MGNVTARARFAHANFFKVLSAPFLPCDVTYAISETRPSAILSHGGQRSRVTIARAEDLGTRLDTTYISEATSLANLLTCKYLEIIYMSANCCQRDAAAHNSILRSADIHSCSNPLP